MNAPPKIVGIEFDGELGRGAHSIVYRGRQNGAPCAIKLPRSKARWSRWIYREAVALARVKHPSLPAVLEVGEIEGLPYLVMELVEGETLADRFAAGTLDEAAARALSRELMAVLAAVHDAGLVHRDVKPRNVILERGSGRLKLVDFGFATPMERVGTDDTAGTAAYAAPEQLAPPGRVDGRSDLYCVGRVVFEAMMGPAGRLAPHDVDVRGELVANGISRGYADLVGSLVERQPEARYPNARAVLSDLDRLDEGTAPLGPRGYTKRRSAAALVGREIEIDRLVSRFREVPGAVAAVRGPRGGGKSRVLAAVVQEVEQTARVVLVSCRQHDPPLTALRQILETISDVAPLGRLGEEPTGHHLRETLGNFAPVATLISPRIGRLIRPASAPTHEVGLDMGSSEALAEGAAEILLRIAARVGPTVLAIDDAQWMDPVSADAIARLAHRTVGTPLGILLAARSEGGTGVLEPFLELRRGRCTVVDLPRFTEEQVGLLVAMHLGERTADPLLVRRIHMMAAGTPLGVLEVLGSLLDAGALRPHARSWTFDPGRMETVVLPHGALVLLGRRLTDLPPATRRVLEMAAVCGLGFDDSIVAQALEIGVDDLAYALAAARRAGLVEPDEERGQHRFVHDSLREILIEDLSEAERRQLHQRLGEVLDDAPDPTFERLYATARHFAAGERERDPARGYRVARAAADAALQRFDNDAALGFLGQAREAARLAGIELDAGLFRAEGEAHLRLGSLDESLAAFDGALERARSADERAVVFGRLSWVYQTKADPDGAWNMLGSAFRALGERMPIEDVSSAASTSARVARSKLGQWLRRETSLSDERTDLLCELHYQNARLGIEYAKPARLIQSSLEAVSLSERRGSPTTKARARAFYAIVLTALGQRDAAARSLRQASETATEHGDTPTIAFCAQIRAMAAGWAGDLDRAIDFSREHLEAYGPWLEMNEYCLAVSSSDIILAVRGCANDAYSGLEAALDRLRRSRTRPVLAHFLLHRVRAALAAIGRDVRNDAWLTEQLAAVSPRDPGRGFHRLAAWGPCARYYLESEDLGAEFENLVREFEAEGHNPRSVHLAVTEYYVTVVQARLHQCLSSEGRRSARVADLERATEDLRASAKMPLLKAHLHLAEAAIAFFKGQSDKATKLLLKAQTLAHAQSASWVLYGVARLRAHLLRSQGHDRAARDEARVAEALASEHGASTRLLWIRREFQLTTDTARSSDRSTSHRGSSSSRTNRQLTALLQVARAPRRDLRTEQQAAAILDELITSLGAERGAIWFQPEAGSTGTAIARHRVAESSVSVAADSARGALLRDVQQVGSPWPAPDGDNRHANHPFDTRRVVAVPLFLYEKPVGALSIERGPGDPVLEIDDKNLLVLLSHQVPIALEIARLLFEREQLHASLQHAKKMEAMGALAGGLAHDFNNMLAAMRVALNAAQERAALDEELTVELDIISQATTRASQLTSQLLSFSRHQPVPVAVHDVNQLISTLEPMLRRVLGAGIKLSVKLSPAVDAVEVDQGSFDQALVNLLINARDAMPRGGALSIATRNIVLGETAAQRASLAPGGYVEIEVADTGEGMSAETMSRIFEPFFTTKAAGSGTGLGLAMVYAFARNCGGSIEVASEIGKGTQFRIYLRRVERQRTSRPVRTADTRATPSPTTGSPSTAGLKKDGPDTILVVDDDDLVRRSIAKILERNGYRVVAASGSVEALDVAREQGSRIALVILDVLMPGLTGPELGRRFFDLNLSAKLLFVSGFSPESIPIEDAQVGADMLLQKPFSQTTLLERVRQLIHS